MVTFSCPFYYGAGMGLLLLLLFLTPSSTSAQNVGISTATPDNSALLDMESTTLGFLPPRVTSAQMGTISSPATGDLVFNTTAVNYYYFTGTVWAPVGAGYPWSITGNSGTSPSTNFLGTKDGEDLVEDTKSTEHLRFYNGGGVGLTNTNNTSESLIFYEASGLGNLYTAFKAGVQKADTLGVISPHYIWPLGGDGLPDQVLVTDGTGDLSWHTFATFSGSGNELLWSRGSGPYGEYSDSANNSTSASYTLVGGFDDNATANFDIEWGDSGKVTAQGGVTAGGSGNSSSAFAIVSGGQDNSSSANYSTTYNGDKNQTSAQNAVTLDGFNNKIAATGTTILNGTGNQSNANYQLMFGTSMSLASAYLVCFRPGTTGGTTKLGIGTCSPSQAADIVGNVKFSGALKPNNTGGSSGQYLLSAGAVSPPTWGGATFSANNWKLLGTSATVPTTNYIGTADANDFVIRTSKIERARITAAGFVGIGTTTPAHQLASVSSSTTDEIAAAYGEANAATTSQSIGVWGDANTSASNTGTLSVLATGNGNATAGHTNAAIQISQGEFTMGRTTEAPSAGSVVEAAANGTLYSQQGPSGVIQLSLKLDLGSTPPTAGVFEDLGTFTINNQFITANSIVLAGVDAKISSGSTPSPKNSVYKVDVESRSTGSCVVHVGMIPFVTSSNNYQPGDNIRLAYTVINPGR